MKLVRHNMYYWQQILTKGRCYIPHRESTPSLSWRVYKITTVTFWVFKILKLFFFKYYVYISITYNISKLFWINHESAYIFVYISNFAFPVYKWAWFYWCFCWQRIWAQKKLRDLIQYIVRSFKFWSRT